MRFIHFLAVLLLITATGRPCWGQFVRPPVNVFRPPVHVPVHVPHTGHSANQGRADSYEWVWWVLGGVGVLAVIGGA